MPDKPNYWAVIPATVRYDTDLPPNAKLLYGEISSLTDMTGYCFATNAYFEQLYELSERTVSRLLKALETRGYIKIVGGENGKRRIFAGTNPLSTYPDKNVYSTPTKMSTHPDKNVGHNNKLNNNPPIIPQAGDGKPKGKPRKNAEPKTLPDWKPDIFLRFWDLYPIHKSKQASIKAWDKLKPSNETLHEMSIALKRQVESEQWKRGIGIPYPSTYLNQRRWEDEPDAPLPQSDFAREAMPWS